MANALSVSPALILVFALLVYAPPLRTWFSLPTSLLCWPLASISSQHGVEAHRAISGFGPQQNRGWDVRDFLGGIGPWDSNADAVEEASRPPPGCEVEQVHMISRHAERYPTAKAGARILKLLARVKDAGVSVAGELAFVRDWQFISADPGRDFEQLTRTGPYAGTLAAFSTGVRLRTRYAKLLGAHDGPNGPTSLSLWASGSQRVVDTAKYFAAGLLGLDWENRATLHVIPETADRGADTLTPGKTCALYNNDTERGREQGYAKLAAFIDAHLPHVSARLEKLVRHKVTGKPLKLDNADVYAMYELCGFEILARGDSPWCKLFTTDEWTHFAYARDLLHYYRAGPGTPYSFAMGALYLNATARLLLRGSEAGRLFFTFVHDGDIAPVLSALHILHDEQPLPTTHVEPNRKWTTSRVMPMGGRVIFERILCPARGGTAASAPFVRINVNDGVVRIPGCDSGAALCPLDDFVARTRRFQEEAGEFKAVCGLSDEAPDRITFLEQVPLSMT
ncbi:uncharacterized protein PV09_00340 [Verruconis gallopava]|uniref:3-phytase n=1 Tax=Verruconis gallopava TaxID=253628 RepID=A0A0D2ASI5_9PEZI|nr:uncharacterized protein PV09_00340 [Verruconis gallopava]KIW09460.1 hypothetical protein PV09_00340 [Verruconis gallopava]